jgi:hypothetical protein
MTLNRLGSLSVYKEVPKELEVSQLHVALGKCLELSDSAHLQDLVVFKL